MTMPYAVPEWSPTVDLDLSRNEGSTWFLDSVGPLEEFIPLANKYPKTNDLRSAIARRHGVDDAAILVTAGGDDALMRCFLSRAGTSYTTTTPTFEMVRRYGEQMRCAATELTWWDGPFPIEDFVSAAAESAFSVVVSPNNPTGQVITGDDLRSIAEASPLVVLDSAYVEFADDDLTVLALELDNVVVVRTLSKAYGLAGIRVGYLMGQPATIEEIAAFGSPYPVSGISAELAALAVGTDGVLQKEFIEEVRTERDILEQALTNMGRVALESEANFVLTETADPEWTSMATRSLGVSVRTFPDRAHLANAVRISVPGHRPSFERLLNVLRSVMTPECLLFDLDGVVVDVTDSYRRAIIATAETFGVSISNADVARAKSDGGANDDWELTARLCRASGVDVDLSEVTARFEAMYQGTGATRGLKENESPMIDAETLGKWKSRLPLGIVTGRPATDAHEVLERFGLRQSFQTVVTRDDAPMKPDPAPVRFALANLGAESGWMLGDTPDDLTAARLAGVVPIAVRAKAYGTDPDDQALFSAAIVLNSTIQLQEILDVTLN